MFGENKLNLILVVAAVLVILVGWQFLMPLVMPTPAPAPPRDLTAASQTSGQSTAQSQAAVDGVTVEPGTVAEAVDRVAAIAAERRITVDGARVRGSILLKGARFDDVTLRDYREQQPDDSPNINVFSPRNSEHPYFAELGWTQETGSEIVLPDSDTLWQTDHTVLKTGSPVTLHWDNGQGLRFTRTISIDENFLFTTVQKVENQSDFPVTLVPYGNIVRFDTPASGLTGMFAVNSEEFVPWGMFAHGGVGVLNGAKQEFSYEDMQDIGNSEILSNDGWMGITGKYWLSALIPDPAQPIIADFKHTTPNQRDLYQVNYRWQNPVVIQPSEEQ